MLTKMRYAYDTEAFLATFEWVADAHQWPQDVWALSVAPLLTGEVHATYQALRADLV